MSAQALDTRRSLARTPLLREGAGSDQRDERKMKKLTTHEFPLSNQGQHRLRKPGG
jgi:hypothetical protein